MLITAFVILRSLFLPYAEPTVDESPVRSSLDVSEEVFKVMSTLPPLEKGVLQKIMIQCVMSVTLREALGTSRVQNVSSWCGPLCSQGHLEQTHCFRSGMGHPVAHACWSVGHCALQMASVCVPFCAEVFLPLLCADWWWKLHVGVAHGEVRAHKWCLYFQKWSIVLGINGKLDHPVIVCNCTSCECAKYSASGGVGLCFLRWWLWRGLSYFSVYFIKPIRNVWD